MINRILVTYLIAYDKKDTLVFDGYTMKEVLEKIPFLVPKVNNIISIIGVE